MKTIIISLLLITTSLGVYSQEFQVPENYVLDKAEDYATYEQDVLDGINWIMNIPINKQTNKRKNVNSFLLKWLAGSPNMSLEIKTEIVTFIKPNPDLLMLFMGGWTKYALESKDYDNKVAGTTAGIEAVIDFYTANKAFMSKDKNVEKYIKMKANGTLKGYIEKNA
jgi:hypothetical protein